MNLNNYCNKKFKLVDKYLTDYPVDSIFINSLPYEVQLIIIKLFDNKTDLLIIHFLLTNKKFNVFKTQIELINYIHYSIKSIDIYKNQYITQYLIQTNFIN